VRSRDQPAKAKRSAFALAVQVVFIALLPGHLSAYAQDVTAASGCTLAPDEYERAGYVLGEVNVGNVFNFVRLVNPLTGEDEVQFPEKGAPFRLGDATRAAKALAELLHGRPEENESPFAVTIVVDFIENCTDRDGTRQLDLVYRVVTSRIPFASGLTFESRRALTDDAPRNIGAVSDAQRLHLQPRVAYTLSDHLQLGGQATLDAPGSIFNSFSLDAFGSSSSRLVRGTVSGSRDADGRIARTEWRLSWSDSERPTDRQPLTQRRALGQAAAQTRPFGPVGAVVRFGASLEGGDQRTSVPADPDSKLLPVTDYGALRTYLGVSLNGQHHVVSGSYGLLLGGVPNGHFVDYRKHVADVAYSLRQDVADHRTLEVESRFSAGWLQTPGSAPAAERFYGGNVEQDFIEGDSWRIRANPIIRSMPNGYFNRLADRPGEGGEKYFAVNVTASVPAWRLPLVPSELARLKAFTDAIEQTKGTAREQASAFYRARDPMQKKIAKDAVTVSAVLDALFERVQDIVPAIPDPLRQPLADCSDGLDVARGNMQQLSNTGYGPIATIIIPDVLSACEEYFASALSDPIIASGSGRLEMLRDAVAQAMKDVDEARILASVETDLGFAFRAFDTLVHEVNAVSVGPAVFFDAARIGPQSAAQGGGVRYGVGGGVRISVMNVMNITAGYAWNPDPRPWEKPGAFFVSLDFIDLFR
jgi:hypothetical protein